MKDDTSMEVAVKGKRSRAELKWPIRGEKQHDAKKIKNLIEFYDRI